MNAVSAETRSARAFLNRQILSIDDATKFIDEMIAADLVFHFEDDPRDIINGKTGRHLFTNMEARTVRRRVAELYSFDWSAVGAECPIGYVLTKTADQV